MRTEQEQKGGRVAGRMKRTEQPPDPAAVVRALRVCRDVLLHSVLGKTVPFGPTYRLASNIVDAIHALADHLSGKDGYFNDLGSGATPAQADGQRDQLAREKGEKPWPE